MNNIQIIRCMFKTYVFVPHYAAVDYEQLRQIGTVVYTDTPVEKLSWLEVVYRILKWK